MSNVQWDGEMDDWFADGYAVELEASRTARYVVSFRVDYDPDTLMDIRQWDIPRLLNEGLIDSGENIVIQNVKITEEQA